MKKSVQAVSASGRIECHEGAAAPSTTCSDNEYRQALGAFGWWAALAGIVVVLLLAVAEGAFLTWQRFAEALQFQEECPPAAPSWTITRMPDERGCGCTGKGTRVG